MFSKIGLQLYTIRDYMSDADTIRESFKKLKAIGYDQAQTAGSGGITHKEMAKIAKEEGIEIVGTHYNFAMMKNEFEATIEDHIALGTTNVGIGGFMCHSIEEAKGLVATINEVAAKLKQKGMKFTYHNHSHEFQKFDGVTVWEYLVENLDKDNVSFVLDTYWVQHAGGDVCKWIEKLAGRIDILHLKDMAVKGNDPYITECGNGNLDFGEILTIAEKTGVKYIVVEQDLNWIDDDPFKAVETSYNNLKKYLSK